MTESSAENEIPAGTAFKNPPEHLVTGVTGGFLVDRDMHPIVDYMESCVPALFFPPVISATTARIILIRHQPDQIFIVFPFCLFG